MSLARAARAGETAVSGGARAASEGDGAWAGGRGEPPLKRSGVSG
ncbi:MAG TPA: hypothetical protein VEZ40_12360 [Pyrinomonadaceae bacterium]|nr:hypothetical protein [Pyrinomonadaceae bacterium]